MQKDYEAVATGTTHQPEIDYVESFWTRHWETCNRSTPPQEIVRRIEYKLMKPYLDKLPRGARLLDGGCGLGEWTVFFSHQGFEVLGLDLSRETVEALQARLPGYKFHCGDIRYTGLPDATFDGIYSWGVFEHFENGLEECIVESRRLLKPGGLLFISVPFQNGRHQLRAALGLGYQSPSGSTPYRFYQWRLTRSELRRELELRGCQVDWVKPIAKGAGIDRFMQWELGRNSDPEASALKRKAYRATKALLGLLLPNSYISHMVMACARKPT